MKRWRLGLVRLDEILPRQLDAGFDGFRSAADEVSIGEPAGLVPDQPIGQFLRRLRGEEGRVGIGKLRGLPRDRLDHAWMLMAKTGNRGATGAIEYPPAIFRDQPYAVAADRLGRRSAQTAVQHAAVASGHDRQPFSETYWDIAASRASVSSRRRSAPAPPSTKVTAASDCAIAIAPVRLGKKPGEAAASYSSR